MCFLAQLSQGIEEDEPDKLNPHLLEEFFGTYGDPIAHSQGTSGAGASPDDAAFPPIFTVDDQHCGPSTCPELPTRELSPAENATLDVLRAELKLEQEKNVRHPPVQVPAKSNPFKLPGEEQAFWDAVFQANQEDFSPVGYGILEEEWDQGVYPEIESLRVGKRKNSTQDIVLPCSIWLPRAVQWARALHVLKYCLDG